jgi:starch-binding outer membrane protein, SusD/RagB family
MKYIKILAALLIVLASCEEEILDKTPLDSYSDPVVWSDINLAATYLTRHTTRLNMVWTKEKCLVP